MANATHATCRKGFAQYVAQRDDNVPTGQAFTAALDFLRSEGIVDLPTNRSHIYWHRLYKRGFRRMPAPMNRGEAALGGSPFDERYT